MKHFNLKSLAMGAVLVGSLFAGNVYAQKDAHGLDAKTLCTLKNGGRYMAMSGFADGFGWGDFGGPNGGNGRIYLERVADDQYIIGGQGQFIVTAENGQKPTLGDKADAMVFTVEGTTTEGLSFSHEGVYLQKGNCTDAKQTWEFNVFGDNQFKAQLDDGQNINVGIDRYSVVMLPFAVSAPEGKYLYKYNADYEGAPEGALVFEAVSTLPAGEPGIYKSTSDDGDRRLTINYTDGDKGIAIAEYVDVPKTVGGIMTGFYSKGGFNCDGTNFMLGVKDGKLGFYNDLTNEGNANNVGNGAYKQNQTNIAYIKANADVPFYTVDFDADNNIIIIKAAPKTGAIIAECVALAAWLQDVKANKVGTEEGQYNVSRPAFMRSGEADWSTYWALWGNLDNYDAEDDAIYLENNTDETALNGIKAQLERLTELVEGMLVERSLGLGDVEIVTLQWNGAGRYSGINGGGKWENPSDFGSPNGGNGRIALVKAEEGKYYIASQAMFIKITAEGKRVTAESKADATAFITTRTSENGLTFATEDGWYLTGSQFAPTQTAPTQDYKINTFGNYANISVADNATELNGIFFSSMIFPFNIQKPEKDGYHTFVMTKSGNEVNVEDVDVVPAGVPFLYVSLSKGDEARMPIPQENQAYVEGVQGDNNLLDGAFIARVEGDELNALIPTVYSLAVKDGKIGYFLGGGFTENTPANRAYITKESADAFGAAQFVLDYNAEAGTLAVVLTDETAAAIDAAIAKFLELNDVVTEATVTNPDRYSYELTAEDDALLDGNYDTAAGYAGKTLEEIEALTAQFQALIDAIKASRNTGLKDVNIVTLQWNKAGRYSGFNGGTSWANPGDFGGPNGANGKMAIIKKENGYVIASQGVFYKIVDGQPGDAESEADATQFTVTGTVEDGLTFEAEGLYLNGSKLTLTTEKPAQSYAVNSFDVATQHYAKASEDLIQVGDVYMAALAIPFKVQKPEGEGYHTYIVNKDKSVTEVEVVPAGVPFIYVSPTNDGEAQRLIIPQDDQEYAATVSTETMLSGFYLAANAPESYFAFGKETAIVGEDEEAQYTEVAVFAPNTAAAGGTCKGFIANGAVENAAKFQFVDGKLIVLDTEGKDITTGVTEIPVVRFDTTAIYNLNGVRVQNPTKGLYIQNGKKVMVK